MAIRLDGKQIAAEIRGSLKEKVDEIRKTVPDFSPGLAIVQESFFMFSNMNRLETVQGLPSLGPL